MDRSGHWSKTLSIYLEFRHCLVNLELAQKQAVARVLEGKRCTLPTER